LHAHPIYNLWETWVATLEYVLFKGRFKKQKEEQKSVEKQQGRMAQPGRAEDS